MECTLEHHNPSMVFHSSSMAMEFPHCQHSPSFEAADCSDGMSSLGFERSAHLDFDQEEK